MIGPGQPFPDLMLTTPGGESHALSELWAAGPALLVFGHSGCDTTRFALPHAQKVRGRRAEGAEVAALLQDEPEDARELASRLRITLPMLLDRPPYPLGRALGCTTVPTLFLVAPGGQVEGVSLAFRRADVEAFAARLGVPAPLYGPAEKVPSLRPG